MLIDQKGRNEQSEKMECFFVSHLVKGLPGQTGGYVDVISLHDNPSMTSFVQVICQIYDSLGGLLMANMAGYLAEHSFTSRMDRRNESMYSHTRSSQREHHGSI